MAVQTHPQALTDLQALSHQIGSDPEQVQAAGGNTSIKIDDTLWIKASGTWLMHANSMDMFTPVRLSTLLDALDKDLPGVEKPTEFVIDELNPSNLRPSIETTVHAVLPHKVVLHVHCVDTIALAVREDAKAVLSKALSAFNWLWVPYLKPGLPLSRFISAHRQDNTDVIVLGNHGLVVAAESVQAAGELLRSVRDALRQPVRSLKPADMQKLSRLSEATVYLPAEEPVAHALAMDKLSMHIAEKGSLYPDHIIFLGDGSVICQDGESVSDCEARVRAGSGSSPVSIVVPDVGVLVKSDANAGQQAMVRCIADVTARITDSGAVHYLDDTEVYELTHWEAEQYRQKLNERE